MKIILVATLLVLLFASIPASAQNMSMSTLGQLGDQQVLIYSFNTSTQEQVLVGTYNTSAANVPLPGGDFNIVFKPTTVSRWNDWVLFLNDVYDYIEKFAPELIIIGLLGFLFLGALRRGRV